jgi:post-segregation antitoxin (ccd killing protein)
VNRTKPRMRRINVTVPGELLARARAAGLNLSEVTRVALAQRLAPLVDEVDHATNDAACSRLCRREAQSARSETMIATASSEECD